uniref:Uncharacterized protein n=1 Tax=Arundo donax TaxID=35708 RepID=A0A0A9AQ37_ARUDO
MGVNVEMDSERR